MFLNTHIYTICMATPEDGCFILLFLFFCASNSVSDVLLVEDVDDTGAVINNIRFTIMGSSCRMNSVAI